ncbi:MAG: DegT/DnrJ/EryC1/StrS family aminotransferase [Muribaculaceae bacterium]|nr:DegT/DnrJ/EryC1/StrS family aminotransferase [Muribaculaceae bacterium]
MNTSVPFLDLGSVNAPYMEDIRSAVDRVVLSGRYVGGPETDEFENRLAGLTGTRFCIGVSNGLDALRLIFRGYMELGRLRPGDEVIVPANTYIASVLAVTDCGLVPVLVEPDERTMNLDTSLLEAALTERTRAVMAVHLYGRACHDRRLADFVARHGLLLVEDNAQAIGARSTLDGKMTGALGDAAAFSFYPTKNIGALGDAGAVTTSDPELAGTVRALANYGSDRRYHNIYKGLNCRLDPVQAAVLNVKLQHLETISEARRHAAHEYLKLIENPVVGLPLPGAADNVWHQFVVRVADRDRFRRHLADNGIGTDVHYATPPHHQPCYSEMAHLNLPVTERLAAEVVSLPISAVIPDDEIARVAQTVNRYK